MDNTTGYSASVFSHFIAHYNDRHPIRVVDGQKLWIVVDDVATAIEYPNLIALVQAKIAEEKQGVFNFKTEAGIKTHLVLSSEGLIEALEIIKNICLFTAYEAASFGKWVVEVFREVEQQREEQVEEETEFISFEAALERMSDLVGELKEQNEMLFQKLDEYENRSIRQERRILCLEHKLQELLSSD